MDKCPIDNKQKAQIAGMVVQALRQPGDLTNNMNQLFNEIAKNYELEQLDVILDIIQFGAQRYGKLQQNRNLFVPENMRSIIMGYKNGVINETEVKSAEQFKNADQILIRKEANMQFLEEAFGIAIDAKTDFILTTNQNLQDCCFVNRGSIDGNVKVIDSIQELNQNIRNYQEVLLKRIQSYLRNINEQSKGANIPENLLSENMYENGRYTNIIEHLRQYIDDYLTLSDYDISELFNEKQDLDRLEAYKAKVLLNNFDTYLGNLLGKSIKINDFNLFTGKDKYAITTSMPTTTTWNLKDLDPTDSVDSITRLIIQTTPLMSWQGDKTGGFILLSEYINIITKIKSLADTAKSFVFDNNFIASHIQFWQSLPEDTRQYLYNKSLGDAIALINKNSRTNFHKIIGLFADDNFMRIFEERFGRRIFNSDEKSKLYSLNRGIFNGKNSIREIVKPTSKFDYYAFITGFSNSIYKNNYIQYFKNREGNVDVRTLLSSNISNYRRKMEHTINNYNSDNNRYNDILEKYKIKSDKKYKSVSFTIPDTNIVVTIDTNSGTVTTSTINIKYEDIKKFIDDILRLNLQNNSKLRDLIVEQFDDEIRANNALLSFAARTLANNIISHNVSPKDADKIYSKKTDPGKYNLTGKINVLSPKDIQTLRNISMAKAIKDGVTAAAQVKAGEGESLSQQVLSRLINSYNTQFILQERQETSATHNFIIHTIPGLFEGMSTIREYYDPIVRESKTYTDMTFNEMVYSQIVYDFIGGIMNKEEGSEVGNGHIQFIHATNSDKPVASKLKFNLNTNVLGKPLNHYTNLELQQLIEQQFLEYYTNQVNAIQNTYDKLEEYITGTIPKTWKGKLFDYRNNFKNFHKWYNSQDLKMYGNSESDFIKHFSTLYNLANRDNPLEFVDNVHYINKKGLLSSNEVILAQLDRWKNSSKFWAYTNYSIAKQLLKRNFRVNTTNTKQPELKWLREHYDNWIDKSGNLIIAKAYSQNITSPEDLEDANPLEVELNPLIQQYNLLDTLLTQEFIYSTVGSFVGHKEKSGSSNVIEQESEQYLAQTKRNVSNTATMDEYQLNQLNGIPEEITIACIDDIVDNQSTISGNVYSIKPFDGAVFLDPFGSILFNNSLNGKRSGEIIKPFFHFKHSNLGTGGVLKCAGFTITNDIARNSPFYLKLAKKMTHNKWGDNVKTILYDYKGKKITYNPIFFSRNGRFYQVTDIQQDQNNPTLYTRIVKEVTKNGNTIPNTEQLEGMQIQSNYDLWQLFGGEHSLEYNEGTRQLQPSETSRYNVVIAMNNVGVQINQNIETQEDLYQPLKHGNINILATIGAVKQGAANINSRSRYTDDLEFDIQKIKLYQAGIQLDKQHQADNSEISLMTQIISACANGGYTIEQAMNVYNALRMNTDISTQKELEALQKYLQNNSIEEIKEVLNETIVWAIGSTPRVKTNFAERVAEQFIRRARRGENVKYSEATLPLSDNAIYNRIISHISSYLTNLGIRETIPGVLGVITPAYNFKIYAGRKYESFTNPDQELDEIQSQQLPIVDLSNNVNNISKLEFQREYFITYSDGHTESKLINHYGDYYNLKDQIGRGEVIGVIENVKAGRNLASYNIRFRANGMEFQLPDLDSLKALTKLNLYIKDRDNIELYNQVNDIYFKLFNQNLPEDLNVAKRQLNQRSRQDYMNLSKSTPDTLQQYKVLLSNFNGNYDKLVRSVNIILQNGNGNIFNGQRVNEDNFSVIEPQMRQAIINSNKVSINGMLIDVDKDSISIRPAECIMPKIYATKFGLTQGDNVYDIVNNPNFFIERYINLKANLENINPEFYTIMFQSANNAYYITNKIVPGMRKVDNPMLAIEHGKKYRVDPDGNILYEVDLNATIYTDNLGHEIIYTNNTKFYIDNLSYDSIRISNTIEPFNLNSILNSLRNGKNKVARNFYKYITKERQDRILELNEQYNNISVDSDSPIIQQLRSKYSSFVKSLQIIAARTPGQSLQSSMPMQVVAFDNVDSNTARVASIQFLLQGSDLDIDTVSLATFDIDNSGDLPIWSIYADTTTIDNLNASLNLPFPTGQEVEIKQGNINNSMYLLQKYRNVLQYVDNEIQPILNTPEQILEFGNFLREATILYSPNEQDKPLFIQQFNQLFGTQIDNIDDVFNSLKNLIDDHNLYLEGVSKNKLNKIVNNNSLNNIITINGDPANLQESQIPIDDTLQPLRDIANTSDEAQDQKEMTAENFLAKFLGIVNNQTGKKCIGISAVGIKTMSALSQYYNTVLNYGTEEEQGRLLFDIDIAGRTYHLLANARTKDPNLIKSNQILQALSENPNDVKKIIELGAILNMATDNAKELGLPKLNANMGTLGMYCYGLAIGMDFNEISRIMMSDTARIISKLLDSNVFTRQYGFRGFQKAFDYFNPEKKEFDKQLREFNVRRNPNNNLAFKNGSPIDELERTLGVKIKDYIFDNNIYLQDKLNNLEEKRKEDESYRSEIFNQMIDFLQGYLIDYAQLDQDILKDLQTLSNGAKELRRLGQILSYNQGIKTQRGDLNRQIEQIERSIYDITKDANDIIDIKRFAFDSDYRQQAIQRYEENKITFNVLDVISKIPHFMGYVRTMAISEYMRERSFKYRTVKNWSLQASSYFNVYDNTQVVRAIEDFVGDYIRREWMLAKGIKIEIPAGQQIYDKDGNLIQTKTKTVITLGTRHGDNSFKLFMEQYVIPKLKEGEISPGQVYPAISSNQFIAGLENDTITTRIGNQSLVYTLNINMSPRTDAERNILNQYRAQFAKLNKYSFKYNVSEYDADGNEIIRESKSIPITDLFTYYTMIAFNWKPGENSLYSILDPIEQYGEIKSFREYEKIVDDNFEDLNFEEYTEELLPFIVRIENPYNTYSGYILYMNPETNMFQIMQRQSRTEDEEYSGIGAYQFISMDKRNEVTGLKEVEGKFTGKYIDGDKEVEYQLSFDQETGDISELYVDYKSVSLEAKVPFKNQDGFKVIDTEQLENLIKCNQNPC